MYALIVKTCFAFCLFSEYEIYINARKMFRNILGNDAKLSQEPIETFTVHTSFISCAIRCEFSPDCEAFNLRNMSADLRLCELFNYKETDIFNKIDRENGSMYFEQVKYQ